MPVRDERTLRRLTEAAGLGTGRFVADDAARFALIELLGYSAITAPEQWRGRSILLATHHQRDTIRALLALDGVAARLVIAPPDLAPSQLPAILADAAIDAALCDRAELTDAFPAALPQMALAEAAVPPAGPAQRTEWVLLTSGTSGRPKLVAHDLMSLAGPVADGLAARENPVWSTFYDVRRYGGMQVLLRALIGGGSLLLSPAAEPVSYFLARAGAAGVTHISGTPSHWRRALMSGSAERLAPRYVRLSGEIADQAILDQLAAAFPKAAISHAFASTEAGLAFDVRDRRAGFPADFVGKADAPAELRIVNGTLRIRSARAANRYLTRGARALRDAEGFIDTGDMVERDGDRYRFAGRREGVINVGGQKVHPEEVEAVIARRPGVKMARVRAQSNPITGALVVADIVVEPAAGDLAALKNDILAACRAALPAHKVPAILRAVPALELSEAGKLVRHA